MVSILLDFPGTIHSLLDRDRRSRSIIRDYEFFRSSTRLNPVQFIDPEEARLFYQQLAERGPYGGWIGEVLRFVAHHRRNEPAGGHRATVVNGPQDLGGPWRRALREEMGNLENWRTPQLIVCAQRSAEWRNCVHDHEVDIVFDDRPQDRPYKRVVVFITSPNEVTGHNYELEYMAHKYAWADLDPWDVRHCNAPRPGGLLDERCRLPRSSALHARRPWELDEELKKLRSQSWPSEGKFWFIPPEAWSHQQDRIEWRKGAFEEQTAPNRRKGPIDYKGQIWAWHSEEGHWDVQLKGGGHMKVKPNGDPWK
jgi:hypothetical protein